MAARQCKSLPQHTHLYLMHSSTKPVNEVLRQTNVSYSQYAAYHSPLNFHSPNAFLPSRWLEESNDRREALQPFSMGPRNCIGQRLALMEVRLVLAKLFWNFDLETVEGRPPMEWAEQKAFTLWEKEQGWVKLRRRRN